MLPCMEMCCKELSLGTSQLSSICRHNLTVVLNICRHDTPMLFCSSVSFPMILHTRCCFLTMGNSVLHSGLTRCADYINTLNLAIAVCIWVSAALPVTKRSCGIHVCPHWHCPPLLLLLQAWHLCKPPSTAAVMCPKITVM